MTEPDKSQSIDTIHLDEGKDVPVGQLNGEQKHLLSQLLDKNKDLFARSMEELSQTNVGEHVIITEDVYPIKKMLIELHQKKMNSSSLKLRKCYNKILYNTQLAHGHSL